MSDSLDHFRSLTAFSTELLESPTFSAADRAPAAAEPAWDHRSVSAPKKERHLFVDNVRFLSIFAVVAIHSTEVFFELARNRLAFVQILITPLKFATIGFFLIAGFLIGRETETAKPSAYLVRRFRKLSPPWLFWYSVLVVMTTVLDLAHRHLHSLQTAAVLDALGASAWRTLIETAFWFVPNLLVSLCVLMLLRNFLARKRLGALLLGITIFYAINVYTRWVPSSHTETMLGFAFYLWLGAYVSRHHVRFHRWMEGVSVPVLLGLAILFMLAAYAETMLLNALKSPNGVNTLRFSNQIFSVLVLLLVYKLKVRTWPRIVDVKGNTFGIYLVHHPVLLCLWQLAKIPTLHRLIQSLLQTSLGSVLLWLFVVVTTYSAALMLTKAIARHQSVCWLVGVDARSVAAL